MARILESAGVHVTMDAFVKDAEVFTKETLTAFFRDLVAAIDMVILVGPNFIEVPVDPEVLRKSQEMGVFADEGGITGTCIVSKSHVSLHAWPLQGFFSFDVFSCGDYDPEVVLRMTRERLGVVSESVNILNRKKPVIQRPTVYCIANKVNGKRYIGKSVDPNSRWGFHVWLAAHPKHKGFGHLHAAIAKYGAEAFTFQVIEVCETEDAAYEAERRWIKQHGTMDPKRGYNIAAGGNGGLHGTGNGMYGHTHTPEARAKMSAANLGRKHVPRTQEHRAAISKARRGEANNMTSLTVTSVREMRERAQQGETQDVLAQHYGVSVPTVSRILRRIVWKHVL